MRDPQDLLALGAVVLAEYLPERVTMADVEGNEFCAFIAPREVGAGPARVFAVCTDSAEPERIAAWWAGVVGARVGNGPDGTPRWLHDAAGWEGLVWKFVRVPDERVVPNRWQWSVRDHTEAVAAGAISTGAADYVDPDGNEFTALVGHPGGPISR